MIYEKQGLLERAVEEMQVQAQFEAAVGHLNAKNNLERVEKLRERISRGG